MALADDLTAITADHIENWDMDDLIHRKERRCILLKLLHQAGAAKREQIQEELIAKRLSFLESLRQALVQLRRDQFRPQEDTDDEEDTEGDEDTDSDEDTEGDEDVYKYCARLYVAWHRSVPSVVHSNESLDVVPWGHVIEDDAEMTAFVLELESFLEKGEELFGLPAERFQGPERDDTTAPDSNNQEHVKLEAGLTDDKARASQRSRSHSPHGHHLRATPSSPCSSLKRQSAIDKDIPDNREDLIMADNTNWFRPSASPVSEAFGSDVEADDTSSTPLSKNEQRAANESSGNTLQPTVDDGENDENESSPSDSLKDDEDRAADFQHYTKTRRSQARDAYQNDEDGELEHITTTDSKADSKASTPGPQDEQHLETAEAQRTRQAPESTKARNGADEVREAEVAAAKPDVEDNNPAQQQKDGSDSASAKKETDPVASLDPATAQFLQIFVAATRATEEEASQFLGRANGSLPDAIQMYMAAKLPASTASASEEVATKEPKPSTLMDEALENARPKRVQSGGDVVIVPDVFDLSKTYRLRSEDVAKASPKLKDELMSDPPASESSHGIKYLYILQRSSNHDEMPLLQRKELDIMRADCEDDFYKSSSAPKEEPAAPAPEADHGANAEKIKSEEGDAGIEVAYPAEDRVQPNAPSVQELDWLTAYEIFIRIIGRFDKATFGISQTDIDAALEKIELVARIAGANDAASRVSSELAGPFNSFMRNQKLYASIEKHAARWLLIAIDLKEDHIYQEAFIHIAGQRPDWPWSVPMKQIPLPVMIAIEQKALELRLKRHDIERKLLCMSLTAETFHSHNKAAIASIARRDTPARFAVVSIFRDWIARHLEHLDSGHPTPTKCDICDRPGAECLTLAGFHRILRQGGDTYLPVDALLKKGNDDRKAVTVTSADESNFRSWLKNLKTRASEIVAPLLVSKLKYEDKDKLAYLTAIEVQAEDVPWDITTKNVGDDDEDDEDL